MISFVGKIVEAPIEIEGKTVKGKAVWKGNKFQIRIGKELFDIDEWNNLTGCKNVYALPTNTYHTPWFKQPYFPPEKPDRDAMEMRLRFWSKYYQGMTLFGRLKDNIFYQRKNRVYESIISKDNKGLSDSGKTISTVL